MHTDKAPNGVTNPVHPKEFDPLQEKTKQEKREVKKEPGKEQTTGNAGDTVPEVKPPTPAVNSMGSNPNTPNPQQGEYYIPNSTGDKLEYV